MVKRWLTGLLLAGVIAGWMPGVVRADDDEKLAADPMTMVPDPFEEDVRELEWRLVPEDSENLSLKEAVRTASRSVLVIKPDAEEPLDAATPGQVAPLPLPWAPRTESQQAILQTAETYYDLMRSRMMTYLAYQAVQQAELDLTLQASRFTTGESHGFDVLKDRAKLAQAYREYLNIDQQYRNLSRSLAVQLKRDPDELLFPADLEETALGFSVPVLAVALPGSVKKAVKLALENHPDLAEIKRQQGRAFGLFTAFNPAMQEALDKAAAYVKAATTRAYEDIELGRDEIRLTGYQLQLAARAYEQVQISYESGFSSRKDVLDAHVAYDIAQVNHVSSVIDYNVAQLNLLYQMGELKSEAVITETEKGQV